MPLFHHNKDDAEQATDPPVDPERYTKAVAYYRGLSFEHRAAEVLARIGPTIADGSQSADALVASLMPAGSRDPDDLSQSEWDASFELEYTLHDAFQALVLARLLIRRESEYKGATDIAYRLSPDGSAALAAGNAADVVARRLPD